MRSIRLSLILCILVLLFLSLVTVSALAYREAENSLLEKKRSMQQSVKANCAELKRKERERLDKALLRDARYIADAVTIKVELPDSRPWTLNILGAVPASMAPQGYLNIPLWWAEAYHPFVHWRIRDKMPSWHPTYTVKEVRLPPDEENHPPKYFQINTATGEMWRSPSMGDFSLAFDKALFTSKDATGSALVEEQFDNVSLNGAEVRLLRARFKRFAISFPFFRPPGPKPKPAQDGGGKEPQPPAPPPPPGQALYVQVAADLAPLEEKLAKLDAESRAELADLETNYVASLDTLRNRFVLIAGLTLLVAVAAGFLVVRWGLSPMRRLSDAVSQVSEKDFHLPVDEKQLPTELRPVAERLAQTLDLLRRAFAREKQAAADISHELRTPLAAMLATIDVALRKPRPAQEYREVLEECRAAGLQMTQLVERMLALARLDAGADHVRPQEVDVNRLADQCSALVRPLAEARRLTLKVEHNGPVKITTDPDKLREVLTNLLHNAIEYNKPEGSIDVMVERNNGRVSLQVRDTGLGIAPEAREHIFERFFRADPSRHAEGLHAGIGLALVKGYVDLMGGDISLESAVGVGTTFIIQLPVREQTSS
jgi:heavy metal sensor kinase